MKLNDQDKLKEVDLEMKMITKESANGENSDQSGKLSLVLASLAPKRLRIISYLRRDVPFGVPLDLSTFL